MSQVEYKGSISFRIVSDRKLHKRAGRRKSSAVANGEVMMMMIVMRMIMIMMMMTMTMKLMIITC